MSAEIKVSLQRCVMSHSTWYPCAALQAESCLPSLFYPPSTLTATQCFHFSVTVLAETTTNQNTCLQLTFKIILEIYSKLLAIWILTTKSVMIRFKSTIEQDHCQENGRETQQAETRSCGRIGWSISDICDSSLQNQHSSEYLRVWINKIYNSPSNAATVEKENSCFEVTIM